MGRMTTPRTDRDGPTDEEPDTRLLEHFARPEVRTQNLADLMAAHHQAKEAAAEPPPATTLPTPEFTRFGVVRFPCPRGCGWGHEEPTDDGGPLRVIASADLSDFSAMLTLNTEARTLAFHSRVETAIAKHYAGSH